jgi:L-aminopeptidase/D-esterase-like protein
VEHRLPRPSEAERVTLADAQAGAAPSLATTIGVVMTDRALTPAQARKVAAVAHDGLARAVRPVHSMTDGDTVFCLTSGRVPVPDDLRAAAAGFTALLTAAADVFAAACLDAMLSATGRGGWPAYADLVPAARG